MLNISYKPHDFKPPVLRFPQYKSLPDDEGERRQLRPGWPDGGPAVGGGEHQAVRGGQL